MKPFKIHRGKIAPLDISNVDTDQIIPKQFLKSIKRTGFGEALFFDWRYLPKGEPNPEFILNRPAYQGASVLVTRNNFGCGSSREHAVWAIQQYGFEVVIACSRESGETRIPAFADIFRGNSFKNALLTIELSEKEVDEIFSALQKQTGLEATVDLPAQKLTIHSSPEKHYFFEMDPGIKERLMKGLDDIAITLQFEKSITEFESRQKSFN